MCADADVVAVRGRRKDSWGGTGRLLLPVPESGGAAPRSAVTRRCELSRAFRAWLGRGRHQDPSTAFFISRLSSRNGVGAVLQIVCVLWCLILALWDALSRPHLSPG